MQWIFLSPHFDDVVLSCGGVIWEQSLSGDAAQIWTICAGEIPEGELSGFAEELHQRWQTGREAVAHRKIEDMHACERIGAAYRHFPLPDCIYRRSGEDYWAMPGESVPGGGGLEKPLYQTREAIFGPIHPAENGLIQQLGEKIAQALPGGAELVCPLAVGGHVDHRLTRAAAETSGKALWYYADFPYVLDDLEMVERLSRQGWRHRSFEVTAESLEAWYESILAHGSQISTFWPDPVALRAALANYLAKMGEARLWRPSQM